jgi:hypothetical protein
MSFASLIKVFPLETPKLLYGDAQIAVAIAPVAVEFGGTMRQWAICAYYKQDDYTLLWTKISYWDPYDQNHLIIIPLASPLTEQGNGRPSPDDVFVIGGATGETLRAVENDGAVFSTVHVTGGAGRISVPRSIWESITLTLEGNWGEGGDPMIGGRDYTPRLPPAVSHW